jgi:hypothetical protein
MTHDEPVRRALCIALSVAAAVTLAGCDTGKSAPTATTTTVHGSTKLIIIVEPHDGDRVTQPWIDTQLVNSRLCRDGSMLSWTENAYWSSTDDVFHARPGTNEITGPPKPVHKCSPVQP